MNPEAFIACNRFGLGAKQGDLKKIEADPRGWLTAQVNNPVMPPAIQKAFEGPAVLETIKSYNEEKKSQKESKKAPEKGEKPFRPIRDFFLEQSALRFNTQVKTDQPFIERLVMFWSNHFTVSTKKRSVTPFAHQFEALAIRPHVTGSFADMLIASSKHPAMLGYLDNAVSVGPNSPGGTKKEKGLNENLAREILELHTLGVSGGYTQADVIALAKIITGWSIDKETQGFVFRPPVHEPGPKTLLGKTYQESGVKEGEQALRDLARHPATAKFIATKLARHFIADEPTQSSIDYLAGVFTRTDGNLKEVNLALIGMKECWADPFARFKSPYEFVLSAHRLAGAEIEQKELLRSLDSLNYRIFEATSPAGYADTNTALIAPDALLKRIEWAKFFSRKMRVTIPPATLADEAYGPVMREETRFIIAGAASGQDGIAFVLSSPEFQRR